MAVELSGSHSPEGWPQVDCFPSWCICKIFSVTCGCVCQEIDNTQCAEHSCTVYMHTVAQMNRGFQRVINCRTYTFCTFWPQRHSLWRHRLRDVGLVITLSSWPHCSWNKVCNSRSVAIMSQSIITCMSTIKELLHCSVLVSYLHPECKRMCDIWSMNCRAATVFIKYKDKTKDRVLRWKNTTRKSND